MARRKCMDISEGGRRFVCIKDDEAKTNPYKLYEVSYVYKDGLGARLSKKQIDKYGNFESVLYRLMEMNRAGMMPGWR